MAYLTDKETNEARVKDNPKKCYCPYPNPTEDKSKCKLCGGNNPKIVESKIKKVKK